MGSMSAPVKARFVVLSLTWVMFVSGCGVRPAQSGPDTAAEPVQTGNNSSTTERPLEQPNSERTPETSPDYLELCSGEMSTMTGVTLKLGESSEEIRAAVERARSQIFEKLSETRCESDSQGFVLTRISENSDSVSLVGGTVKDCQAVECIRRAVAEAAAGAGSPWEHGQVLGVQLDSKGRLGRH